MPKTKLTPFLLLVPCGAMLCALNATAACAQEVAPPLPPMVAETIVAQPALLDRLRAGTMTAEAAWDKKLLDEKSALALLEGGLGSTEGDDEDQKLRAQLAGALMKHAPQSLEPLEKKSLRLKRAVADGYASVKDERAIAIYEALAARPEYSPVVQATTLRTLGNYQRRLGKTEEAVASFLQAKAGFEKLGIKHATGEMLILAARTYSDAGQDKKAQLLYAQVAPVGDGWMTGLALYDQANALIDKGSYEEARKFLTQPVVGEQSEQIKLALVSTLGYTYFRTGDFKQARVYIEQSVSRFEAIKDSVHDLGVIQKISGSRNMLRLMELWTKQPIICEPQAVDVVVSRTKGTGKPIAVRLTARTFISVPLQVTCDNPQLTLEVAKEGREGNAEPGFYHFFGRDVLVRIPATALEKSFDAVLTIRSPKLPGAQTSVQIHVEVEP